VLEILRKSQMKYAPECVKNALIVQKREQHFKNVSSDMLLGLQAIMQQVPTETARSIPTSHIHSILLRLSHFMHGFIFR